jgi:hypothetical protein
VTTRVGEAATAVAVGPAVGVGDTWGDKKCHEQHAGDEWSEDAHRIVGIFGFLS